MFRQRRRASGPFLTLQGDDVLRQCRSSGHVPKGQEAPRGSAGSVHRIDGMLAVSSNGVALAAVLVTGLGAIIGSAVSIWVSRQSRRHELTLALEERLYDDVRSAYEGFSK